ncbi:hypothetical protein SAMN05216406_1286 [Nitrosomonas ureae]|uniref:Uncharacterized protein n=1 Tax=Nitrosomonas ureae TaxID=44577 RepID=A0A1H2G4X9_9PROT|nr:hypothetical protein SAMN05216406_1286 [Nitrosomonas ureae]
MKFIKEPVRRISSPHSSFQYSEQSYNQQYSFLTVAQMINIRKNLSV